MALRVLIIPDKFKGTLTAVEAARTIAAGWNKVRPSDELTMLPMSDGGDGFGAVTGTLLRARKREVKSLDAAHRLCRSAWWWEPKKRVAIVESASVVGLAMLPAGRFHPFQLDTFGLGQVLAVVAANRVETCMIGVGGSATNDGGFGLARSLGWEFCDRSGRSITEWTALERLFRIRPPAAKLALGKLRVVADVTNPLLGRLGASRVYGPQKGLRPENLAFAERCLRQLVKRVKSELGIDLAENPGSGAAGGLGYGLQVFAGAELERGFDAFARFADLENRITRTDLVVTGEGKIDRSSVMGKGTGRVADLCKARKIPCLGVGGVVEESVRRAETFRNVQALVDLTTPEQAMLRPGFWLRRASEKLAQVAVL